MNQTILLLFLCQTIANCQLFECVSFLPLLYPAEKLLSIFNSDTPSTNSNKLNFDSDLIKVYYSIDK